MTKLTQMQVAVLRAAVECARTGSGEACTTYLCPPEMTVKQTWRACFQLEGKGLMERRAFSSSVWRATTSGTQWLRSLDAGRPWMVRGHKQ